MVFEDGVGSFDGAFERAGIDGIDPRVGEPLAERRRLGFAFVVEMNFGRPSGQFACFDKIVDGVANEEKLGNRPPPSLIRDKPLRARKSGNKKQR
jgi:hypothetical protein